MSQISCGTGHRRGAYLIDRQLGPAADASVYASIISVQVEAASLGHGDWG